MTKKAFDTYRLLHGVTCLYKPPGPSIDYLISRVKYNILKELNSEGKEPKQYLDIDRSSSDLSINVRPSYADNILCSGPRYQSNTVQLDAINALSDLTSGVSVFCINDRGYLSKILRKLNFTKCYHVKGVLGQATTNFHINNKVLAKANYGKVTRIKFEKIIANYQSTAQKKLFAEYGFALQSQEAYDLAVQGLYRPSWKGASIIYSIKLLDFQPPDFTLEVQCIHTVDNQLAHLIHDLGVSLKCFATCAGIRCLRHGCFHVDDALVKPQWTLDEIVKNIKLCWDILEKNYPQEIKFSPTVSTVKTSEAIKLNSENT